jgi:hypothetical protein
MGGWIFINIAFNFLEGILSKIVISAYFKETQSKTGERNEKNVNGMRTGNGSCVLYVRLQLMPNLVPVLVRQSQGYLHLL